MQNSEMFRQRVTDTGYSRFLLTLPPSSHPLSNAFHHPFSILPLLFSPIREFDSSRFYERHEGGVEAENKGDGSMINCESR